MHKFKKGDLFIDKRNRKIIQIVGIAIGGYDCFEPLKPKVTKGMIETTMVPMDIIEHSIFLRNIKNWRDVNSEWSSKRGWKKGE